MSIHRCTRWVLVLVLLLSVGVLLGCIPAWLRPTAAPPRNDEPKRQGVFVPRALPVLQQREVRQRVLWVLDHTGKYVVPFVVMVPRVEGMARDAVGRLIDNPTNVEHMGESGLKLPLPAGTAVRGLTIRDGQATLDLNEAFLQYNVGSERLIVDALVLTLTEFDNVERVQLQVGGKRLARLPGGTAVWQPLMRKDRLVNEENATARTAATVPLTLYFSSASQEEYVYFVPVTRHVPQTEDLLLATVNELIRGPLAGTSLLRDVPAATKVRSLRVNAMGVAEVDFSREIYDHVRGETAEVALMGSLVLSLTEHEGVKGVRVTVEGRAPRFNAGTDITRPILRPVFVNPFIL
ncbi:MAG: GerMN domain-containing protein [Selenomonadales bacterium]|nr:GerMN domain-containing protein [Selenomonadales bacterium]